MTWPQEEKEGMERLIRALEKENSTLHASILTLEKTARDIQSEVRILCEMVKKPKDDDLKKAG